MNADAFFAFARARHAITIARAYCLPRPWTDDPILQTYRFTNVFRERDATTVWISRHVRQPLDEMLERGEIEPWQQVLGMILAREFNRVTTLEQIFCQDQILSSAGPVGWAYLRGECTASDLETNMRAHCKKPWVTGAYIIKTPDGMDKLAGALWMVEATRQRLPALAADRAFACSMEALHADLVGFPYLGQFTAYEIVTDLRWMAIGRDWPDIMTWAAAGPGAIRGLHRIHGRDHRKSMTQRQALAEMRDLLRESQDTRRWPTLEGEFGDPESPLLGASCVLSGHWPEWELREVEHTLCEFDKYERVRLGQGAPRGRYR